MKLLLLIILPLTAFANDVDLDSYAGAIYNHEGMKVCRKTSELPSLTMHLDVAEDYLKNELEEIKLMKARNKLKKEDAEKYKIEASKPADSQVNEADYQIALLNRMLADELDTLKFCQRRSTYLTAKAYSFEISGDLAIAENKALLGHDKGAEMFPSWQRAACDGQGSFPWLDKIKAELTPEKAQILQQKFEVLKSKDFKSQFETPDARIVSLKAQYRRTKGQAKLFSDCVDKAKDRVAILEESVFKILEKDKKIKHYVLCHTREHRLFRTQYCELPFTLTLPEAEWPLSNRNAKAFRLDNPEEDAPMFEADGNYIPIIHLKETEWDGKSFTTLCWNKNLGVFFDATCKDPISTHTPMQNWVSTLKPDDTYALSTVMKQQLSNETSLCRSHVGKQPVPPQFKTVAINWLNYNEDVHLKLQAMLDRSGKVEGKPLRLPDEKKKTEPVEKPLAEEKSFNDDHELDF